MNSGLPWLNAPDILAYGISGLAFLLATLTFLIIKSEQRRAGAPRQGILRTSSVFMAFCLILAGLSLALPLLKTEELKRQLDIAQGAEQASQAERGRLESRIDEVEKAHSKTREELVVLEVSLKGIAEIAQFNDKDDPAKTLTSLRNAFATIQVLTGNVTGAGQQIQKLEEIATDRERLRDELANSNVSLARSSAATEIITRGQGTTLEEKIKLIVAHVEDKAKGDEQIKTLNKQLEELQGALGTTKLAADKLRAEVELFDPFRPVVSHLRAGCTEPDAVFAVAQEAILRYDRFPLVEKEHRECHVVRDQALAAAASIRELEGQNKIYREALELCKTKAPPAVCTLCKGSRQIASACTRCEGAGEITSTCSECDGDGDKKCTKCAGYGGGTCRSCNGSGRLWCAYGPCMGCNGTGVLVDGACGGTGLITCGSCEGVGRPDCPRCVDGERSSNCSACKGSGSTTTKCVRCAT